MTTKLEALLARIDDDRLRRELAEQISDLDTTRQFGLVFETHLPERCDLPKLAPRRGSKVTDRKSVDDSIYVVVSITGHDARLVQIRDADGIVIPASDRSATDRRVSDLVVVAEFGDPIYPGLTDVGSVYRNDDRPAHVVVNAENHHALDALRFTDLGRVDCIYIDPPYNTGARDWTYNNDYVDENDIWRHSKWLSMMQRRLSVAKDLLTDDGVVVVTIDEHEVHTLGLLLREVFPNARQQMVTIVNNAAGVTQGGFYRVEEYAFFCFLGGSTPQPVSDDLLSDEEKQKKGTPVWFSFIRYGGTNAVPQKRPNLVYPIAVDPNTHRLHGVGPSLKDRIDGGQKIPNLNEWRPDPDETIDGHPVIWPFRGDGSLSTWQANSTTLPELANDGFVRFRPQSNGPGGNQFSISYVKTGNRKKVLDGTIPTEGRQDGDGPYITGRQARSIVPKTVWKRARHDAGKWGSRTLREMLGSVSFDYAKSPYAVLDTLRTVLADRPDAVVLDFFAGSGTTLHALAMLNAEDEGRRRCVLVTNNQVDAAAHKRLARDGHQPGDDAYEAEGIFQAVTRPRVINAITGHRDGKPIDGKYQSGDLIADGFDENVRFVELTYQDPAHIELDLAFAAVAPMLWMRAGSAGDIINDHAPNRWAWTSHYGILWNTDLWNEFLAAMPDTANTVFIVTDSATLYSSIVSELPHRVDPVRLYENYLMTFATRHGSSGR